MSEPAKAPARFARFQISRAARLAGEPGRPAPTA